MDDRNECECNRPHRAVRNDIYPVGFDDQMGEFYLVTNPSGRATIWFCPWCGGAFPESKRESFFTTPSADDVLEVESHLKTIGSTDEMQVVLGVPDHTTEPNRTGNPWLCQYTYSSKWETLELFVHEAIDGTLSFSYGGKYIGNE